MSDAHDALVFGPMGEGEPTISGGTFDVPGWAWSCTCGAAGRGYATEADADAAVEAHDPGGAG